jgi:phosphoenolpyruvate-protein kinase (PTS system EI component)
MAADRENMNVADYFVKGNDIILTSLQHVLYKAHKAGIDCSVCGELAGDLNYTDKLLKIGLRNFSVAPHLIPHLKYRIKTILAASPLELHK